MRLFQSKCDTCGCLSYVFPDQVQSIKKDSRLTMHKYCRGKLKVGKDWFCIKCDASKKDGTKCKIVNEIPSEKAKKLIDIRSRETNLTGMGFYLGK